MKATRKQLDALHRKECRKIDAAYKAKGKISQRFMRDFCPYEAGDLIRFTRRTYNSTSFHFGIIRSRHVGNAGGKLHYFCTVMKCYADGREHPSRRVFYSVAESDIHHDHKAAA